MINTQVVEQKLQDQALNERMIEDSIFILASVEYTQNLLEQKLLEIDTAESDYRFDDLPGLRDQVISLLAKLKIEEKLMEEIKLPEIEAHKAQHALFVTHLENFMGRYEEADSVKNIDELVFLKGWFMEHIQVFDKRYAEFGKSFD